MKRKVTHEVDRFEPAGVVNEFLIEYAGAAPKTLRNHTSHVRDSFLRFLEEQDVGFLDEVDAPLLRRWLMAEANRRYDRKGHVRTVSPNYVIQRRLSVHRFLQWCVEQDYLPSNPLDRVRAPRKPQDVQSGFSRDEAKRLVRESARGWRWIGVRDRAIVTTLLGTGARADELLSLTEASLDWQRRRVKLHGKNSKERWVPMGEKVHKALRDWIKARPSDKHLWLTLQGNQFTYQSLSAMLKNLGKYANVENVHPHRFRHTYAAEWWTANRDLYALKNLLGHSRLQTTEIYLRSLGLEYGTGPEYKTPDSWLT